MLLNLLSSLIFLYLQVALPCCAVSKIVLVNQEDCELKEIWVSDIIDRLILQVHFSKSYSFSNKRDKR